MLLGVYWYYGFPESLYHFDFFRFRAGRGGHADGPAELTVTVRAPDPAALLAAVRAVAAHYPQGYIFGKVHGAALHLDLGDYALTYYTFHVAGELEKVLRQQRATPSAAARRCVPTTPRRAAQPHAALQLRRRPASSRERPPPPSSRRGGAATPCLPPAT